MKGGTPKWHGKISRAEQILVMVEAGPAKAEERLIILLRRVDQVAVQNLDEPEIPKAVAQKEAGPKIFPRKKIKKGLI